jgi:hypothetical protein
MKTSWLRGLHGLLILACVFVLSRRIFERSAGDPQICDSCYSMLVTDQLLRTGEPSLPSCVPTSQAALEKLPGYIAGLGTPYHFIRNYPDEDGTPHYRYGSPEKRNTAAGPYYYGYPLGSSILSMPFVIGRQPRLTGDADTDFRSLMVWDTQTQLRIAAIVAALTVCVFVLIARHYFSWEASVLLAFVFALGSPVWSTMSRGLWSHTWAVCLLCVVILLLQRLDAKPGSWRDPALGWVSGHLLFWVYFVRPQCVISMAALCFFLLLFHRRALIHTLLAMGVSFVLLAAWSRHMFGTWTPPVVYSTGCLTISGMFERFVLVMFGPSRGLLILCPMFALSGYLLWSYLDRLAAARWLIPSALAIAGQVLLMSCYEGCEGGSCFGPRYFTDVLPWFFLLMLLGIRGMANVDFRAASTGLRCRLSVELLGGSLACAWAIFVHARGACVPATMQWNGYYGSHQEVIRSWKYPQYLAGMTYRLDQMQSRP